MAFVWQWHWFFTTFHRILAPRKFGTPMYIILEASSPSVCRHILNIYGYVMVKHLLAFYICRDICSNLMTYDFINRSQKISTIF
jgi:hypothetical protein